jgi:hypothetical protein
LHAAQREWEAAKEHAAQLETELVVAKDNVMVGQRREAHKKTVAAVSSRIHAIYRLKNPRKLADVPGGCPVFIRDGFDLQVTTVAFVRTN